MPHYIFWQNALNPKKIHRQIWSSKTHVDKGKWLELDPGAQRNIAYRTWYFDCRLNVNNNNSEESTQHVLCNKCSFGKITVCSEAFQKVKGVFRVGGAWGSALDGLVKSMISRSFSWLCKFRKLGFCSRLIFEILIIHKPSLGSREAWQKILAGSVQPFWRLLYMSIYVKL